MRGESQGGRPLLVVSIIYYSLLITRYYENRNGPANRWAVA